MIDSPCILRAPLSVANDVAAHEVYRLAGYARCAGVFFAALLAVACTQKHDDSAGRSRALVIGRTLDAGTVDPGAGSSFINDRTIVELTYEPLLKQLTRNGQPTGEVTGALVKSWQREDEAGLIWRLTLNSDHRFDDGSTVTTEAVKYSLDRMPIASRNEASTSLWLDSVEVIDRFDLRVRFKFVMPSPLLRLTEIRVVNPAVGRLQNAGEAGTRWLSEHTAGSGPYRLDSWERGTRMLLVPNPYANHAARYFNRVILATIKDANARRLQFLKGDIDIFEGLTPELMGELQGRPGITLYSQLSPAFTYIGMNNDHPVLKDVRIRRAIASAIDYRGLLDVVLKGQGGLMNGPLPPGTAGYDAGRPFYARDLAHAVALMHESGFATRRLALQLAYVESDPTFGTVALIVQQNLADIGIDLRLTRVTAAAGVAMIRGGQFDMFLNRGTLRFVDPWSHFYFNYRSDANGTNWVKYSNPQVDRLIRESASTADNDARAQLYRQVAEQIAEDQPEAYLYVGNALLAYRNDLRGVEYSPWDQRVYNVADMARARDNSPLGTDVH